MEILNGESFSGLETVQASVSPPAQGTHKVLLLYCTCTPSVHKMSLRKAWRPLFGVALPILLLPLPVHVGTPEAKCGYVLLLMAGYFTFEPVPLAVTALLPIFLFPLMGIVSTTAICYQYMKDTIMMYLGGLIFATAVEHANLHKRIALKVLLTIGTSPRWILLGFMVTTMFLSMWITNTATTAMMVPIVNAVISELSREFLLKEQARKRSPSSSKRFSILSLNNLPTIPEGKICNTTRIPIENFDAKKSVNYEMLDEQDRKMLSSLETALMLSLAFAASFGGIGTLIGSGPNLVLKAQLDDSFPDYKDLNFSTWMMYNIPGMLISTFCLWILFQIFYVPWRKTGQQDEENKRIMKEVIRRNYDELGKMTFHEAAVLGLFVILVILWLMRDPQFTTGWADLFPYGNSIKDATPAIGISIFLFIIPARPSEFGKSPPLLDWKMAQSRIPWGVLLLLGGGIAMAEGAQESGLSHWIVQQLEMVQNLPPDVIAVMLCIMTSVLTEFISNMSMATIMLPVVCQMAIATKVHPLLYMLPVTIACSFAFMFPVGNPSNAIVFDSCDMKIMQMVKPGIAVKVMACVIELIMIKTLGVSMFNMHTFPSWANKLHQAPTAISNVTNLVYNTTMSQYT